MASYQDKAQIGLGVQTVHKFPLHQGHLTTSNFMHFDVAFARELCKGTDKHNHQTFVRTMPLKKPVMGSVQIHLSSFFVPYRTVWEPWTDFITDTPHNQPSGTGIITNVPLIDFHDVITLFRTSAYSTVVTSGAFDFRWFDSNSNAWILYRLTAFGRHSLKLLNQLGYRVPFADDPLNYTKSALPLLCVAKCYQDWFYPNQYAHYGNYASLDGIMQRQVTYTLTQSELNLIFDICYLVAYNSDYFTSAFESPTGNVSGTFSTDFVIADISNNASYYQIVSNDRNASNSNPNSPVAPSNTGRPSNGTPYVGGSANTTNTYVTGVMTQYVDDSLKALTNYIKRHALVGSRALERYLADWGVALSADKLKRCYKLSEKHFPLQVGDVMATADTIATDSNNQTTGASLGDYAGKAVAFEGDLNYQVDTDEFGYEFVICTIIPDISYIQGYNKMVDHKFKLDFLTGDFDGLGVQPIKSEELFVGMKSTSNSLSQIFGFVPRYAEMKVARDLMTGDLTFGSVKQGLQGWDTARLFDDEGNANHNIVHSFNFVLGNDYSQYERIFFNDEKEESVDRFIIVHRDNFELHMPAKPLYDNYDWEDAKKILIDVNGVKTN